MVSGFRIDLSIIWDRMVTLQPVLIGEGLENSPSARQFESGNPKNSRCEGQVGDAVGLRAQHDSQVAC